MKKWFTVGLILAISVAVSAVLSYWYTRHVEGQHRAGYQATLAAYRAALAPGTSREQVESFLRSKGVPYRRTCCAPGVFSDLTKIGQEPPNLVCREWGVYLEFKFDNETTHAPTATPTDGLTSIDIHEQGICL
jgi:hypothetical protein